VVFLLALASFARRQDGNHESLQLDLTYPTMRLFGSFSLYLDVQYFTGYGESLLGYNKKSMNSARAFRFSDNRRSTPASRQTGEDRGEDYQEYKHSNFFDSRSRR